MAHGEDFGYTARLIGPAPRPAQTYPPGRACVSEGCWTKLSIYNESDRCWVHAPLRYPLVRGKRRVKVAWGRPAFEAGLAG